jgi:peptidoglycan/LPS O-acetylase OafA/YrhL
VWLVGSSAARTSNATGVSQQMGNRIPSLDGARAASIGLVIAGHLLTGSSLPIIWRLHLGALGVRTFFVISGFIISTLLLRELETSARIDLKAFYVRRAARIFPAYWLFVGTVAVLIPTGLVRAQYSDLPVVLAYFSNYHIPGIALGHTWSLSVEEQFYLLWPATLMLAGVANGRIVCTALIVVSPAFRVLADLGLWPTHNNFGFECVCDSLATGCLLAMLRSKLWALTTYRQFVSSPWVVLVLGAIIAGIAIRPDSVASDLVISLLNLAIAATLDRYMRFPQSVTGRLLNSASMVWVGTISYGLYLWQQLFAFGHLPVVVRIAAPLSIAAASYYLVEGPVRRTITNKWCKRSVANIGQMVPGSK